MNHPTYTQVQDRFSDLLGELGADTIADALSDYLPTDDVPEYNLWDFCEYLDRLYS